MRINEPVTQRRVPVSPDVTILSTTDPRGKITYVNDEFVRISGFSREELIGAPHNIVRHPDMPRLAFQIVWDELQAGRSWMGLVKNRCKNGDHYWVHAYATPIMDDNGKVVEYQSVRQGIDDDEAVARAEKLYATVRAIEPRKGRIDIALPRKRWAGLRPRITALVVIQAAALAAAVAVSGPWWLQAAIGGGGAAIALGLLPLVNRRIERVEALSLAELNDPLAELVYTGRQDEAAHAEVGLLKLRTELRAVTKRLVWSVGEIATRCAQVSESVAEAHHQAEQQKDETSAVATSMEEISIAVQEIAENANAAAGATGTAREHTQRGLSTVAESRQAVGTLVEGVEQAAQVIRRLSEESNRIGAAMALIQKITGQTNLLALNAAVEAARAGETGRGFAVVAEEVRALADRTAHSAQEIQQIIQALQDSANDAVTVMEGSREHAESALGRSDDSRSALEEINTAVDTVRDMNAQIASATEEQSATANEISGNITNIDEMAGSVRGSAENADHRIRTLLDELHQLRGLVTQLSGGNGNGRAEG